MFALAILLFVLSNSLADDTIAVDYSGYQVYRVQPVTTDHKNFLKQLSDKTVAGLENVEFLSGYTLGKSNDLLVPSGSQDLLISSAKRSGLNYELTVENLQKLIDSEKKSFTKKSSLNHRFRQKSAFDIGTYHSHKEINEYLNKLHSDYPSITEILSIGTSFEGRDLLAIKIGKLGKDKKEIYIDGGIHAREWLAVTTATYILTELITKYQNDSNIQSLVDTLDWYILPVVNPDGYEYSRNSNRMWRKNRSNKNGNCIGVDLNRNFPMDFGGEGTSNNPCSDIFRGSSALSEPESSAVANFILSHKTSLKAYVALHSYSQLWLVPYGNTMPADHPEDIGTLMSVAGEAANAAKSVNGYVYEVGNSAVMLGAAAGAADDWAKKAAEIKFVYTIEVRPTGFSSAGFIADVNQILPTGKEIFEGVKVVAASVAKLS